MKDANVNKYFNPTDAFGVEASHIVKVVSFSVLTFREFKVECSILSGSLLCQTDMSETFTVGFLPLPLSRRSPAPC